jgi:hypothetical protein
MEYLNENGYAVTVIAVGRPFYEIQHERMAGLPEGVPAGYEDLATINQHMLDLQNAFPTLARRINVTQVFGGPQTFEGRDIYALRISDNVRGRSARAP